jgi:hypothetical protein
MSTQGPYSPQTAIDSSGLGTITWSNPERVVAEDGNRAQSYYITSGSGTGTTHYIKATNFGFAIPTGMRIDGILVEIKKTGSASAPSGGADQSQKDSSVKIVKANGSIGTTNKAKTTQWPYPLAYVSHGGAADLWGESWTPEDITTPISVL